MFSSVRRTALGFVAVLGCLAIAPGGSAGTTVPFDARSLVTHPREVGGIRSVTGAWTYLGNDGTAPLADAIGPNIRVPENIAHTVTYGGLVGGDLKTQITSIAVVLPSASAARRLLARTDTVERFLPENSSPTSPTRALYGADAMRSGQSGGSATIAWTNGRLYGLINASGPAAGRAAQLAAARHVDSRARSPAIACRQIRSSPQPRRTHRRRCRFPPLSRPRCKRT